MKTDFLLLLKKKKEFYPKTLHLHKKRDKRILQMSSADRQKADHSTDDSPKKMSTSMFIVNLPQGPAWFAFLTPCDELCS